MKYIQLFSIDTINYTTDENSECLQKQLNYNTADESLKYCNEICQNECVSKGGLRTYNIQNSEPSKKSLNDEELLDILFPLPMTQRKPDQLVVGLSKAQKSNVAEQTQVLNCKVVPEKLGDTGCALFQSTEKFSSINLSSHFDYNLSASESVENADTGSQRNKLKLNKSKLNHYQFDLNPREDKFHQSGHTLEFSEDDEEKIDEEALFLISEANSSVEYFSQLKQSTSEKFDPQNIVKDGQKPNMQNDNILVRQSYMDEYKSDFEEEKVIHNKPIIDSYNIMQSHLYTSDYYDSHKSKEIVNDKIVNEEALEIENFSEQSPNLQYNLKINGDDSEEKQIFQSLFDPNWELNQSEDTSEMHNQTDSLSEESIDNEKDFNFRPNGYLLKKINFMTE